MRSYFAILIAYLLASIPFGYIVGMTSGTDIRKKGSGNTGATNALRTLGWKYGLLTFILDFAKGYLGLVIAKKMGVENWALAGVIIVAAIGHCYSVFLSFEGGKGVAIGAGLLAFLGPIYSISAILFFLFIAIVTKYVSLASILASLMGVIIMCIFSSQPIIIKFAMVLVVLIIICRHRSNIDRLKKGVERKLGE